MFLLLFTRLGQEGEYLIPGWGCVRLRSIMVLLVSREGKHWEHRIQQHGRELIDVCFMDMAEEDNCR
jgi:hypothetical protein